ncbi:hypothetical protein ACNOYE_35125 [Nannocystaceae bacterium ST9]
MKRHTTLLLTTLLLGMPACDKGTENKKEAQAANKPTPAAEKPEPAREAIEPGEPAKPEARTVASGLDLGMRFAAFDIVNCDSGDKYCQVCQYGSSPKIMAVGTIDDEQFKKDLQDLDAIVAKYGDDKVKAFAVIAESKDGALVTPLAGAADLQAKAKALKEELGINMPIVVPAPEGAGVNGIFEDHYQVKQSRTIMFADGKNEVKYTAVAPENYQALDEAIKAAVG